MYSWECQQKCDLAGSPSGFWKALQIWIKKPHVLNRRLCGTLVNSAVILDNICSQPPAELIENQQISIREFFCSQIGANSADDILEEFLSTYGLREGKPDVVNGEHICNAEDTDFLEQGCKPSEKYKFILRSLLPKQTERCPQLMELIVYDGPKQQAIFMPVCTSLNGWKDVEPSWQLIYSFRIDQECNRVELLTLGSDEQPSMTAGCSLAWLEEQLFLKLCRWSGEEELNTDPTSLKLVPVQRYNQCYQYLKHKYGIPLVQNWPESTDPQKFVFEDIAITAYLMVLWEEERLQLGITDKQTFVDLGCGNGLLVYLLQSEGHQGIGLDLKKRKIWDTFGPNINLQERVIKPCDEERFPSYDWLIGNHSDELTPWIPVIAARSSYKCRFFLLPCCPWDFDCKFNSKQKGQSVYQSYLEYVREICVACGFSVKVDTMRIPSTKKVCLVGGGRCYAADEEVEADAVREQFIKLHSRGVATAEQWTSSFQARPESQPVRNCVGMDRALKQHIYTKVFSSIMQASDAYTKTLQDGRTWHAGGSVAIPDLAKLLQKDELDAMKAECGGLQTLLKNFSHIFRVQGGRVQLRQWDEEDECWRIRQRMKKKGKQKADSSQLVKTKLCWFHDNHQDGCPRQADSCYFAHGQQDLRTPQPSAS